jgi:drug/metabolite transporter (DMT)-like permease
VLLAAGYALQTAGLERTTPSSAGFITGLYVVLVPLVALVLFREQIGRGVWVGALLALVGLAMLSGVDAGSATGDLLILGCALTFGFQIPLTGRFAPQYDPLALTLVQMLVAFVGFTAIAGAAGEVELPRGGTVWAALLVTGVFASALAYLIQTWAQRTNSAAGTALVYAMEPVFAGLFGYLLAGDRLGAVGWAGCAIILAGIIASEPAAAEAVRRSIRRSPGRPRRRARSARRCAGP